MGPCPVGPWPMERPAQFLALTRSSAHTCFLNFVIVYDGYTGVFVVTFPYIHILYPGLIHPSIILPTPILKMTLIGFNGPYLYMYQKHIKHIHLPLSSSFTLPLLLLPFP
jgi:hypothetical protein